MTINWNARSHTRSDPAVTCLDGDLQTPGASATPARQVRWVGADPESDANECPAVAVMPETGDFLFRGKTVTDPAVIAALNQHIGKADDESDVWLPARMASLIRQALDGYEQHRRGPGQHTLAGLMTASRTCAIRFEALTCGELKPLAAALRNTDAGGGATGRARDRDAVRAAVARGVQVRRLQLVHAPAEERDRDEPERLETPAAYGEDVRKLSRASATDLLLPGADCWVFDYRVVRWDVHDGDPTGFRRCTFSSDPRVIRDIAAAFELAWSRAIMPG